MQTCKSVTYKFTAEEFKAILRGQGVVVPANARLEYAFGCREALHLEFAYDEDKQE